MAGLKPQTSYFFKINSAGKDFDNNGTAWQAQTTLGTLPILETTIVSGNVLTASSTPVQDALVYVSFGENFFSSQTSQNGSFLIPIEIGRASCRERV